MQACRVVATAVLFEFLLIGLALAQSPALPVPEVVFEGQELSLKGFTAAGDIALFGAERRVEEYSVRLAWHTTVLTASADGTARWVLDEPIAVDSLWIVVDQASGKFLTARPSGELKPLPALFKLRHGDAGVDYLEDSRPYVAAWPSPGFVDTKIGPRMGLEVFDGDESAAV